MAENCQHMNFAADVSVGRIVDDDDATKLKRMSVEVRVKCTECGIDLEFQGLPVGIDTHGPTRSVDGLEARLVAVPKDSNMWAGGRVAAIFDLPTGRA